MKNAFFSVLSLFLLFSALFLILIQFVKIPVELTPAKRIDDDVKAIRQAIKMCKKGKGIKVKNKFIVEVELQSPETKTKEMRKIILNSECKPVQIVY